MPTTLSSLRVFLILSLLLPFISRAQTSPYWTLDPNFNPTFEDSSQAIGTSIQMLAYPGARVISSGSYALINGQNVRGKLVRLSATGQVETDFNASVQNAAAVAVYDDGRVLIKSRPNPSNASTLVQRLLSSGEIDLTFTAVVVNNDAFTALILPDDKILLSGDFSQVAGVGRFGLARLNGDGSLDTGFTSPFLTSSSSRVTSAELTADGQAYIATGLYFEWSGGIGYIVRLLQDGSVDPDFDASAAGFVNPLVRTYPQPDGGMIVIGSDNSVTRLTSSGGKDTVFASALIGSSYNFGARQADGKIFYTSISSGNLIRQLRRMNPDGSDDSSFVVLETPYSSSYEIGLPVLNDDGSIFVGALTAERAANRHNLTRVNVAGIIDPDFNPRFSRDGQIGSLHRQSDGRYLVYGRFSHVNGLSQPRINDLIRLNPDGTIDSSFSGSLPDNAIVSQIENQPDGKILVFGNYPAESGGQIQIARRYLANGSPDPSFQAISQMMTPWGPASPLIKVLPNGTIYLGFADMLRRYTADGVREEGYQPNIGGAFTLYAPMTDGSVLLKRSGATTGSGTLVRLLPSGVIDPAFTPVNADSVIEIATLPGTGVVFCEQFNGGTIPGGKYYRLSRAGSSGNVSVVHTPALNAQSFLMTETQMSIAGVLLDVLREPEQGANASIRFNLTSAAQGALLFVSANGQMTMQALPSFSSVNRLARYQRTPLSGPSFDAAPFVRVLSNFPLLSRPLNSEAIIFVQAGGLEPLSYQWLKNGIPVPGQISSTLRIDYVQASDAGDYSVIVSNPYGSATSETRPLTVDEAHFAPKLVTKPEPQTVLDGATVTFTASATGDPAISYQWSFNGVQIAGATAPTLTLSTVTLASSGVYQVIVSNFITNAAGGRVYFDEASATLTVVTELVDPNEAVITSLYEGVLGEAPTAEQLTEELGAMAGGKTKLQVLSGLLASPGYQARQWERVIRLYYATFGRMPDYAGLYSWSEVFRSGTQTPQQIGASFAGSSEFTTTYGSLNNTQFVQQLYRNVLGREADQDGLDIWGGELNEGMTRGALLLAFADSGEFQDRMAGTVEVVKLYTLLYGRVPAGTELQTWQDFLRGLELTDLFLESAEFEARFPSGLSHAQYVDVMFQGFLRRGVDSVGLAVLEGQLNASQTTRARLLGDIVDSNEFATVVAPVVRFYLACLNRTPDVGGLDHWTYQVRSGTSLAQLADAFALSGEFATRYGAMNNSQFVNQLYVDTLGRGPDANGLSHWTNQLGTGADTRASMLLNFANSTEAVDRFSLKIRTFLHYLTFLQRSPSAGELDFWANYLATLNEQMQEELLEAIEP